MYKRIICKKDFEVGYLVKGETFEFKQETRKLPTLRVFCNTTISSISDINKIVKAIEPMIVSFKNCESDKLGLELIFADKTELKAVITPYSTMPEIILILKSELYNYIYSI